jgi:hypothetical protein
LHIVECEIGGRRWIKHKSHVESIKKWTGQPSEVPPPYCGRAGAVSSGLRSARARVRRGNELKAGRELDVEASPTDGDDARLKGLAQRIEDASLELWRFIEKQHTAMRERDEADSRHATATANYRNRASGVMRCLKRWTPQERVDSPNRSCNRVDRRHFKGRVFVEVR